MLEREPRYIKEEDPRYLKELLEFPVESRNVDYKAAVKFDRRTNFAAKLVKHILALANSGGGHLIVGYKEQKDKSIAPDPAITDEIVASYEVTKLCQHVEKYLGDQDRIAVRIYKEEFAGIRYPIIKISRFQQYPCVCMKDCKSSEDSEFILRAGCIYIRTESAETRVAATIDPTPEWRQLIRECIRLGKESL